MRTLFQLLLLASPVVASALWFQDAPRVAPPDPASLRARELLEAYRASPAEGRSPVVFELDDAQRREVDFFPLAFRGEVRGRKLGDMTLAERRATHALLRELLSEEGYLRVQTIRELEEVLWQLEGRAPNSSRIVGDYALQVFGAPAQGEAWAFKLEGHHLSLNATLADGELRGTPLFLGANPAEVRSGEHAGLRVLAPLEDLAHELVRSLDDGQWQRALGEDGARLAPIPRGPLAEPGAAAGLSAAEMSEDQRELLLRLVEGYTSTLRSDFAQAEMQRLRAAGVEKLHFRWRGSREAGEPHAYRIQGPTAVIQLDAIEDRAGAGANHLHCLWSDPERDFGDDLLERHYEREHGGER